MKKWIIGFTGLLMILLLPISFVSAEDDHEEYKYIQRRGDHDDEDRDHHRDRWHHHHEEGDEDEDKKILWQMTENSDSWKIWNKTPEALLFTGTTPFDQPTNISITGVSNQKISIEAVPVEGQVMVPLEDVAKYLGANVTYYPKINIAEVIKGEDELLFKLNTRVAYQNREKLPIPVGLIQRNETLYIPVSVISEGLGYQITWNEQEKEIILKNIEKE